MRRPVFALAARHGKPAVLHPTEQAFIQQFLNGLACRQMTHPHLQRQFAFGGHRLKVVVARKDAVREAIGDV